MNRSLEAVLALTGTLACTLAGGAWIATAADAAGLPAVRIRADNPIPDCATPGRMMAYLYARNPALDQRYAAIATHYMRQGQELGVRWDYAFFQMIVETGSLSFRHGDNRPGTVRAGQNNFAGLGASGGGAQGDSFPDIATGVKAHLQHLLMYAGERIEQPVAERTRKVQEWGVLTAWHKTVQQPVGFADVTRKWATDPNYTASVEFVGRRFFDGYCVKGEPGSRAQLAAPQTASATKAEPQLAVQAPTAPQLTVVQSKVLPSPERARAPGQFSGQVSGQVSGESSGRISGVELARAAVERARAEGDGNRSSLGFALSAGDSTTRSAAVPLVSAPVMTASAPSAPIIPSRPQPEPRVVVAALTPTAPATLSAPASSPHPAAITAIVPAAKPVNPADEAIRTLVSGKTVVLDATMGATIPIVFRDNGSMRGTAGSLAAFLGSATDEGRWWVARGRLCQRWNVWLDRETQCLTLRQAGSVIHWVRDDGKSGTARIASR